MWKKIMVYENKQCMQTLCYYYQAKRQTKILKMYILVHIWILFYFYLTLNNTCYYIIKLRKKCWIISIIIYLPNILAFAELIIFTINDSKNVNIVNMIKAIRLYECV